MMLGSIYRKLCRWVAIAAIASAGTVMALPGCDAEVSNTLVDGFESAATTAASSIISALFESVTRATETTPDVSVPNLIDGVPTV